MYKVTWIVRYPEGMDKDEAQQHWRGTHAQMWLDLPELTRYVQNDPIESLAPEGFGNVGVSFDGYSCAWFGDRDVFQETTRSAEWKTLVDDASKTFDSGPRPFRSVPVGVEEHTIREGESSPFKTVWIVRFKEEYDREEVDQLWIDRHGHQYGAAVPGWDRYVQNHVSEVVGTGSSNAPSLGSLGFDGWSETWFKDRAAFDETMKTPEWLAMNDDGEKLFDWSAIWDGMSAVLEERVLKG